MTDLERAVVDLLADGISPAEIRNRIAEIIGLYRDLELIGQSDIQLTW